MALDDDLSRTEGLNPSFAVWHNRARVQQARDYILGPLDVPTFLDTFLPRALPRVDTKAEYLNSPFERVPKSVGDVSQISHIYEPLTAALNTALRQRTRRPRLVFEATFDRSVKPLHPGYMKPHICCFTPENAHTVRRADPHARAEFGYAELFLNVNPDPSCDIFVDPPADISDDDLQTYEFLRPPSDCGRDPLSEKTERMFGLHIAFAMEVLARQNRIFLFSVSLCGSFARFFRWDRAGCIVTEAFDIHDYPQLLLEFVHRFSLLSHAQRGHDLTVRVASAKEEALFRDVVRAHVHSQLEVEGEALDKAVTAHYQPGRTSVIQVHSGQASGSKATVSHYIVSRPVISPLTLMGRGTRGYWAVCRETGRIGFLKDTWRQICVEQLEGDILQKLNAQGVRNVPIFATHGHVPDSESDGSQIQRTLTERYMRETWTCLIDGKDNYIYGRVHYRIVFDTVGYNLKTLRGTEELLSSTYDVLIAMRDALTKGSRLHRDLSVGNMILVKEPGQTTRKGYLIDWDASDGVDASGQSVNPGRAGTWDYMSIRMLGPNHDNEKHTIQDDMESLLYLVLYCALLYLPHNLPMLGLTTLVQEFFRQDAGGIGGEAKRLNAVSRRYTRRVRFRSTALQEWLHAVMDYHSPTEDVRERCLGMWTPEHLDAFWSAFLEMHALERDDRIVNKLSMAGCCGPDTPFTSPSASSAGDSGAQVLGKRSAAPSPSDLASPASKRCRKAESKAATPRTPAAAEVEVAAPQPQPRFQSSLEHTTFAPRRSARIRERQARAALLVHDAPQGLRPGTNRRTVVRPPRTRLPGKKRGRGGSRKRS
ncbi:hypothetical protein C8Q77DRAFT_1053379 [Trametes polyzona]|nr:hypothetical protein C8Q77DRAFT_1053379 [Trametes polyzona]